MLRPCDSPYQVGPIDVVHFLMNLDRTARTRVHVTTCAWKNHPSGKLIDCGCPTRAHASSLRTVRKTLRSAFGDLGVLSPWCQQSESGNPVWSRLVKDYEAAINREQLRADVHSAKAPLFDFPVLLQLLRTIITSAGAHARDRHHRAAIAALSDAFLFSFMFATGDRLADALERDWSKITPAVDFDAAARKAAPATDRTHWVIRRGVSKTRQKVGVEIRHTVRNDGNWWNPIRISDKLASLEKRAGMPARVGKLFKKLKPSNNDKLEWGFDLTVNAASKRLAGWLKSAQLPSTLTPHSFHGSHALWRLQLGHDAKDIVRDMHWSEEQLWSYLDQPVLTVSGERLTNATAYFRRR